MARPDLVSLSSEDLISRAAAGDGDAFEVIVRRHQSSILNLIYRYLGDRTKAADLAQEVFLRIWRAAARYEPKAKFTTWIYRITANLCLNEIKSAKKGTWVRFQEEQGNQNMDQGTRSDVFRSPEDLLLGKERTHQISQALQTLPENQRMALILSRYEHISYVEIAEAMGCSVSAVESLLVRAKRNLQEKLFF
jgi:RNA polymerase sigma-70 factor, ECF subfamily